VSEIVERGGTKYEVKGRVVSDVALEPGAVLYAWTKAHTSSVVVLRLPDEVAREIALDTAQYGGPYQGNAGEHGALSSGDLHLTLAYLGDTDAIDDETRERIRRALRQFSQGRSPVEGTLNGRIVFDVGKMHAFCAHLDAPELPGFRADLVEALEIAGAEIGNHHGFTPHVTLAYLPEGAEVPGLEAPEGTVELGNLELWEGPLRAQFELGGIKERRHSRSRCMSCEKAPEVEVKWAGGRGRAWFCKGCYEDWKKEYGEAELEIIAEREVTDGKVTPHWNKRKKGLESSQVVEGASPEQMAQGAKPWTVANPPPPATNWTDGEKERCVETANAVLRDGGSEQDAIFACIRAAGKTQHPGGEKQEGTDMKEITVLIEDQDTVTILSNGDIGSHAPPTATLEVEEGEKAWDGNASRWPSTESYCRASLINLNAAAGKTDPADWTQALCKLPTKNPGSDEHDFEGVQAAAGALSGARTSQGWQRKSAEKATGPAVRARATAASTNASVKIAAQSYLMRRAYRALTSSVPGAGQRWRQ